MKFIIAQIMILLFTINIALAADVSEPIKAHLPPDLSNFPDMFVKDGNFNAVIVVGDKAAASDVIAQSNLAQFFVRYTEKSLVGSIKLSSEIGSLNQNIVSIGSACHNNVSWEIMVYPKQCDIWLEPGKAMIILYDYKGYVHMVIAGYSDKGTRDAVNALINYEKSALRGSNILIDVNEPKPEANESGAKEKVAEKKEEETLANIEKEKLVSELTKRIANKSIESNKKEISRAMNETKEKSANEQKEQKKETKSVMKRLTGWILSLFGRS